MGVNPKLGLFAGLLAFALLSEYVYWQLDYAGYVLLLLGSGYMLRLNQAGRDDFLVLTFGRGMRRRIRMIENLVLSLPFIAFLLYKGGFVEAATLLGIAFVSSFRFRQKVSWRAMPTPFRRYPYEFTVGFRQWWIVILLAYGLSSIAFSVGNFNLGIFSLLVLFLIVLSFYGAPEHIQLVWVYSFPPKAFLWNKLWVSAGYAFLLALPVFVLLTIGFSSQIYWAFLAYGIGVLFVWVVILAKYAVYPHGISLPQGILISIAIYFPPLLLILLPYLYRKSVENLKMLFYD